MKFKGDIIITDPCYIIRKDREFKFDPNKEERDDDWAKCNFGDNMEALGINHYLTESTIWGDWSCTTYKTGTKKVLGHFCADAGLVSVFLLEEVLKYNPDFDYHIKRPHTTTWIKNFDGDVEIKNIDDDGDHIQVVVIGKGNINFFTRQTGL